MGQVAIKAADGTEGGKIELDESVFGLEPNMAVMHQVVTAQLAARRSGTQSTLTRSEVRGGGAKPWKQKGTGRARAGSIRAPQWRGGGVALGPKPRDYRQRTPKKMVRLALRSALSDRAADGKVIVVDQWRFEVPKTSEAVAALSALGIDGTALIVLGPDDMNAARSFRNLPGVQIIEARELNAYDVLVNDYVVFTTETLPSAPDDAKKSSAAAPAPAPVEPEQEEQGVSDAAEQSEAADEVTPESAEPAVATPAEPAQGEAE